MFRSLILNTVTITTKGPVQTSEWSDHKWTSTGVKRTKTHWQHIWEAITQTTFGGGLPTFFQQHAETFLLGHTEGPPTHLTSSLKEEQDEEEATTTVVYRLPDVHLVHCVVNVAFWLSQPTDVSSSCLWIPLVQEKLDTETFLPPNFRYYDTR